MAETYTVEEIQAGIEAARKAKRPDAVADLEKRLEEAQKALNVSGTESFLRGGAQTATLGLGDEIEGAIQAALPVAGDTGDFFSRYRKWRDSARRTDAKAQAANPKTYLGGQLVGGAVTAPAYAAATTAAAPIASPAGPLGHFINAASQGAVIGSANGVGTSQGDLTRGEVGQVAWDAALNAALGGAVGGTVAVAAPPLARVAHDKSIEYGRKVLSGISTPMSHTRKPIPEAAVDAAYTAKAIKPFGTTPGTAERLEVATDAQGAVYDALIARLEAAGVDGPGAQALARRLLVRAEAERPVTWQKMDPIVNDLREVADEAVTKVDPLNTYTQGFDPPMPLSQIRALTGNAQRSASGEYAKVPNKVSLAGDSKMAVAGELRSSMEDAVQAQASKAPGDVAQFLPEKEKLANLLWALQEAREGAGKAARRGPLGFTDVVMAAPQVASGNLGSAALTLGATKTLVPRIASTMGWSYRQAEEFLKALAARSGGSAGAVPGTEVARLGAYLRSLGQPGLRPAAADGQE